MEELRENLKDGLAVSKNKARTNLSHAMVVGIACDVCKPEDVRKLANFAVDELGSVDIWVSLYILDILRTSVYTSLLLFLCIVASEYCFFLLFYCDIHASMAQEIHCHKLSICLLTL